MRELEGKMLARIRVSADGGVLAFDCWDGEVVVFVAEGDCCSETWFADITGVSNLLGAYVMKAETVDMDGYNVKDGRCRQKEDTAYGYKIHTNFGIADIVYRNSSNGYYGGSLETKDAVALLAYDMKEIMEDWSA